MTAAAYTAMGLTIAGCAAYAARDRIRSAVIRARRAWLCRKPPARTEGKLNRADYLTFTGLVETWRQPAAPERTRT